MTQYKKALRDLSKTEWIIITYLNFKGKINIILTRTLNYKDRINFKQETFTEKFPFKIFLRKKWL
jgi:hypothetical protein